MPTLSGKSCIVDCIIVPFSPARGRDRPERTRTPPGRSRASTAVVHPRVPHGEHRGVLVELEARSRRSRRGTTCARRARPSGAPRSRGTRPPDRGSGRRWRRRGTGKSLSVRASRSTSTGFVNLRTIARSSWATRFTVKTPPSATSSCVNASRFDAHTDELRVERELRDPVDGHAVATLAGPRAEDVEPARHLPEHAATQLVVLLRVATGGHGSDDSLLCGHPPRLGGAHSATSGRRAQRRRQVGLARQAHGEREVERRPHRRLGRSDRRGRTRREMRRRARRCGHAVRHPAPPRRRTRVRARRMPAPVPR